MTTTAKVTPTTTGPRPRRLGLDIGLWILGAFILTSYAGLWRPIWLDEFLHFAMGGMSFEYALKTIDYTTIEVNHGQTGVYMLLDWALLQVFGASAVALRLPSLVSAALLLAAAVTFFRLRGFGYLWQYLVLLSLAAHSALMFFTGEARPYMPLAAASVAVLAYYQYAIEDRRRPWPIALGIFGVVGGALLHPYIVYMIAVLLPFSVWVAVRDGRISWSIAQILRFANLPLLITGGVTFLAVGQLTWMRRVLSFGYDPLERMQNSWAFTLERAAVNHFANQTTHIWWILGLLGLTLFVLAFYKFSIGTRILPPTILILLGILTSVTVSALSALRSYWILERQWVAGVALVAVGGVWFFAEFFSTYRNNKQIGLAIPVYAFIAMTVISATLSLFNQLRTTNDLRIAYQGFNSEMRPMEELRPQQINNDEGFIYAANVNVARGDPVWTMFVDWYDNLSGMRPEFREKNPSWTGFLGSSRTREESTSPNLPSED